MNFVPHPALDLLCQPESLTVWSLKGNDVVLHIAAGAATLHIVYAFKDLPKTTSVGKLEKLVGYYLNRSGGRSIDMRLQEQIARLISNSYAMWANPDARAFHDQVEDPRVNLEYSMQFRSLLAVSKVDDVRQVMLAEIEIYAEKAMPDGIDYCSQIHTVECMATFEAMERYRTGSIEFIKNALSLDCSPEEVAEMVVGMSSADPICLGTPVVLPFDITSVDNDLTYSYKPT